MDNQDIFQPVDIRTIPDDKLDDIVGGSYLVPGGHKF
jgi:hypothetical protein